MDASNASSISDTLQREENSELYELLQNAKVRLNISLNEDVMDNDIDEDDEDEEEDSSDDEDDYDEDESEDSSRSKKNRKNDVSALLSKTQQRLDATTDDGVVKSNLLREMCSDDDDEEEEEDDDDNAENRDFLMLKREVGGKNSRRSSSSSKKKRNSITNDDDESTTTTEKEDNDDDDSTNNDSNDDDGVRLRRKDCRLLEGFPKSRRRSIATTLQEDLEDEVQKYSQSERELLVSMVIAEEAASEGATDFNSGAVTKEDLQDELMEVGGMDAIIENLCRKALTFSSGPDKIVVAYEDPYILLTNVALTLKNYYSMVPVEEVTTTVEQTEQSKDNKQKKDKYNNNHKIIPLHTIERVWLGKQLRLNYFTKKTWGPIQVKKQFWSTNNDNNYTLFWAQCNDSTKRNNNENNFVILCNDVFATNNNKEEQRDAFTVDNPEPVREALAKYIIQ